MMRRGPKRKFNPNIPRHIDQDALPARCYWDNSGRGHWYTTFKDDGRLKRKRIAGPKARLSDLHKAIEEFNGINRNTFRWVAGEYFKNSNYSTLSSKTQDDYQYCFRLICDFDTKIRMKLADVPLEKWSSPVVQKFIDTMKDTPTKSKHVHSFIRRVFSWGKNRGYCSDNPAIGTELPKERKKQTLPTQAAYDRLLRHAKANGTHGQKTQGSCPHYIWAIMEINYLCYLRGVETRNMTDAHIQGDALLAERRKGSRTSLIEFNDRLKQAIDYLIECRKQIWESKKIIIPIRAENRPLVVNTLGERLNSRAYQSAWQRFIKSAIQTGVIEESERFSLHDLKRKGITDTDQDNAGEHKDPRMAEVYDKSIRTVKPASE